MQEGKCKFNKNCSYAHGEGELRKPYEAIPKDQIKPSFDHHYEQSAPQQIEPPTS